MTGNDGGSSRAFDVDLHAHTRFFHSWEGEPTAYDPIGAELLGVASRRRGIDGVALTNHDYYADVGRTSGRPLFIPGIEVSTTQGHVLVVGPDPPSRTRPRELTPGEVVDVAHAADCAAIVPHPYRHGSVHESGVDFDAVEVSGKHPGNLQQIRDLGERLGLPVVAGSDAHFPFEAGRAYTRIHADALTPESVVDAIRDGRVEPRIRDGQFQRVLQRAYGYIHKFKRRYPVRT
ncbi:PHP domain-containing protein [Halobacterium sp. R2-5]|uniref:PHP domain-containing protein n=1 Tax=Halobacterium sp. R2-5 TaxID=2715751 RepID=UPI0014224228|nr:PHP domain-containing protein [Halobacterium sp. R2-5]NIB99572.1 PHP domain-containing protein [Halobacterium sp. R2-5]